LKAPGTKRLTLKYDELLSIFAFIFNLRRYIKEADADIRSAMVGRCRLKPVLTSTEYDVLRLGSLTQCPCVILCDVTTCYSMESAWFQRLKEQYDKMVSNFAFIFNLRRYTMDSLDMFDKGEDRAQCLAAGNTATDEGADLIGSFMTFFRKFYDGKPW